MKPQVSKQRGYRPSPRAVADQLGDASSPCEDCGSVTAPRSACPLWGKVVCPSCAETPYEFCCEETGA